MVIPARPILGELGENLIVIISSREEEEEEDDSHQIVERGASRDEILKLL